MLYLSCKCHKIQNNSQILLKRAEIGVALIVFKGHAHPYIFFYRFLLFTLHALPMQHWVPENFLIGSRLNNTKVYLTPFLVFKIMIRQNKQVKKKPCHHYHIHTYIIKILRIERFVSVHIQPSKC